jgi:hypothetical protein
MLARAQFVLARTLTALDTDPARARRLADAAHAGFMTLGAVAADELAEVDAWRRRHRAPGSAR